MMTRQSFSERMAIRLAMMEWRVAKFEEELAEQLRTLQKVSRPRA